MRAGVDAPILLKGQVIFYRPLKSWSDVEMRKDKSTGFDLKVFEYVKNHTGVLYVVAYGENERKMNIAPVKNFSYSVQYGQGVQMRAKLYDTKTMNDVDGLEFPTSVPHIFVESEGAGRGKVEDIFELIH